jgi:hypothetical protein
MNGYATPREVVLLFVVLLVAAFLIALAPVDRPPAPATVERYEAPLNDGSRCIVWREEDGTAGVDCEWARPVRKEF